MYTRECVCMCVYTHTHVHTHTPRYISHFYLLTSQTPPPASQPARPPTGQSVSHWVNASPRTNLPAAAATFQRGAALCVWLHALPEQLSQRTATAWPSQVSIALSLPCSSRHCFPSSGPPPTGLLPPSQHPPRTPLLIHSESVPHRSSSPGQPALPAALGPCPETPKHALEQRSPKVIGSS